MHKRKRVSGGQAIVMVTLSLMAMTGMMGLAVDLGWSYFVQKEAQASADSAALGAVQEAVNRLGSSGNISGFNCGLASTGSSSVDCKPSPVSCGSVSPTSNLNNGCLYAKSNGFDYTNANSRQIVTIQSSDLSDANRPPGVNRMSYWVRVRTIQNIPQLFSFVAGNQNGTVAANGTAAIAGSIHPGSFFGMNQKGDCLADSAGNPIDCGIDVLVKGGQGGMNCAGAPGGKAKLCAPAGIILGSSCSGPTVGCDGVAGSTSGAATVYASSLVAMTGGTVTGTWTPNAPSYSSDPNTFLDPTYKKSQPPLQATGMASCGVTGSLTGNNLGPYQYYHYANLDRNGKPIPDGAPVTVSGNATFKASGTCPNPAGDSTQIGLGGNTQGGSAFPTYVFYGGMNQAGTTNLGPGQYVMAGTTGTNVFDAGGTISGDLSTGTMFIFTDGDYPGLTSQRLSLPNVSSMPTLWQGTIGFTNADITMGGLMDSSVSGNLPASLNGYEGIVWWQDRRNSTVEYNQTSSSACGTLCKADDGTVVQAPATAAEKLENHVRNDSPGVILDDGNVNLNLSGVYYQPRGAWLDLKPGTAGLSGTGSGNKATQLPLQIITGALINENGGGDTGVLLAGPTNPIITYKAVLIQ